ncbi:hypothetical protein BDP27DRAFT_1321082 [Rhodocollybia butyracea]|uniref:Uncharacterized protein n=1 Tax=Rhodocollybia butyracea TaxID=206335 RepID=A0A9P5PTL0_9AGAR|nr:hypothetical protein BDP27DRAFT_1321082 [Rhodocollybia butyracea]
MDTLVNDSDSDSNSDERSARGLARNTPSEKDVENVRHLLRTLLPLELVDLAIEYAEYWPCLHSESPFRVRFEAEAAPGLKIAYCYLLSLPIPNVSTRKGLQIPQVKRIEIHLQSHDQGWATHSGPWFEATIVQDAGESRPKWLNAALNYPLDLSLARADFQQVFAADNLRWHIASNQVANRATQHHSVVWTKQEADGPKDAESSKGREGLGHELVRALKPGDRVAILALAEQWGWENHVESGSIDIYYSV